MIVPAIMRGFYAYQNRLSQKVRTTACYGFDNRKAEHDWLYVKLYTETHLPMHTQTD